MGFTLLQQFIFSFCIVSAFIIKTYRCNSCTYIKVESAGYNDGNYAKFTINSVVYSIYSCRGFNILVLDSSTLSTITASGSFDTYGSSDANTNMKSFIDS